MKAAIYARYSSDNQTEMSILAQVRACEEYAKKKGIDIIAVYKDEAKTGTNNNREGYNNLLIDAFDNKFDLILIHKYDRIARNLEEQVTLRSRLKKLNIRLIAVAQDYGEGKDAELSKGIQWVLGEYYSANLAEEVRKGLKEVALEGKFTGGVAPFGYDIADQKYIINEAEAYYVRWMFKNCIEKRSYNEIIESMKNAGVTGKRGKTIEYPQIYEILHNEKYTGVYVYSEIEEKDRNLRRSKPNAIRIPDIIPQIVDLTTFNKAQEIMLTRKRSGAQKHRCSGLVYCAECGAKMHLSRTERKGHKYNNFRCSTGCGAHGVPVEQIDEAVDSYLNLLLSEKNIGEVETALNDLVKYNKNSRKEFEQNRKKMLEKAEKELDNLVQGLMSGKFKNNYELLEKQLEIKNKEIEEIKNMKQNIIEEKKIREWISGMISQNFTPGIFIDRIEANTTSIKIVSTFTEVVGNLGCGGAIQRFPTILYGASYSSLKNTP